VATDDLTAPLGQGGPPRRRLVIPPLVARVIAGALGLCITIALLWVAFVNDPLGGEPTAVVSTDMRPSPGGSKAAEAPPSAHVKTVPGSASAPDADKPGPKTITIIDGMSGKHQEVVIGSSAGDQPATPGAPPPAPSPVLGPNVDQRLIENTRNGPIPKIGNDGTRPADAYARRAPPGAKTDGPRVAVVVSGLGIGASGTGEALARLPGPITLAFAPYGTDVDRWVARARGEGHEVLLQVPMEPFDYPDNDPGPQTLLIALRPEQNIDRLHWFMGRFVGYVGITSYMGARFIATDQAVGPVVREAAKRGLIYFDDGASPRSLTGQIAAASNAGFAKADVQLDAVPTPTEIDVALAKLEALARERGVAVGAATALPVSIDRLSQWVKASESRGITLVPISAAANKPKSS
jgi:polysaccharide deacetylase 2 family uncharacterized protein YibQ